MKLIKQEEINDSVVRKKLLKILRLSGAMDLRVEYSVGARQTLGRWEA